MSTLEGYIVSYAQNREDIIIASFFPDVKNGIYVDVGANDPVDDSVTKIFYDDGWSGLNVEPNPKLHAALVRERNRDINVNMGASEKRSVLKFREYDNHGLSTFSPEVQKIYENNTSIKTIKHKDYNVNVLPTKEIFKEHIQGKHINFMKVDVEGYEYNVLAGNDWKIYRPELICIEANRIIKDWHPILKGAQYELVFHDGLNEYFLRKESMFRAKYFNYENVLLLNGIIINPGVAKRLLNSQKDSHNLEKYLATISILNAKNAELNAKYSNAIAALNQQRNIKKQLRSLYDSVDAKILRTIDKRGHIRKTKIRNYVQELKVESFGDLSINSMLDIAKEYDIKTQFRYHSIRNIKKIHYRVIESMYRTSRDSFFKSGKMTYKVYKKVKGSMR